ncbi:rhomboid-related protein 1/2/3 [Vigna unguiculata]|uniref:RHOMBOID-like protein n=1 Tax=Vigna unguiculata TaxID=3917 RepID=A0A4D6MUB4_VIGUN|nr:rhomboid-related protein 1/2/3 [Vigna unguiculata]
MGALDVGRVVHRHQGWRLVTCMWLHAGVFHLLANMLGILVIGIRLEQEFGFVLIGLLFVISGFGGSLLSALFIQSNISVGASGALFGLLGGMLSELITNWTIYENKLAALLTLVIIIVINLAVGILPHVDNFAHIGGFLTGFLLGFVFLIRPQFGWVNQRYAPLNYSPERAKPKFKKYQCILWVLSLVILIVGLLSALFIQSNISVGASGALFGLLGGMLSELITNWTIYENKLAALLTLVIIIVINLAVGILPHVDNFAHIGGFLTGFLLGFVFLIRPQFGWVNQRYAPLNYSPERAKPKFKKYQCILWVLSLVILIVGYLFKTTDYVKPAETRAETEARCETRDASNDGGAKQDASSNGGATRDVSSDGGATRAAEVRHETRATAEASEQRRDTSSDEVWWLATRKKRKKRSCCDNE